MQNSIEFLSNLIAAAGNLSRDLRAVGISPRTEREHDTHTGVGEIGGRLVAGERIERLGSVGALGLPGPDRRRSRPHLVESMGNDHRATDDDRNRERRQTALRGGRRRARSRDDADSQGRLARAANDAKNPAHRRETLNSCRLPTAGRVNLRRTSWSTLSLR